MRGGAGMPARFTSLHAWRWGAATVASRTMHLPGCPAGALTPFGDLHNHQAPPAPLLPDLGAGIGLFQGFRSLCGRADALQGPAEAPGRLATPCAGLGCTG